MSRQHFFFNLGALGAAVMLIVGSVAFGPDAVRGVGLGIGTAGSALSLMFVGALMHRRRLAGHPELWLFGRGLGLWSTLGGAMAGVATWEIVSAAVFVPDVSRWLTLANGLLIAMLACAGLVAHEICTERVIHVIEVVERPPHELA
jgi:peptidoglycan biosynthesis protein MviN/MurJ (putative lipid II flippase)